MTTIKKILLWITGLCLAGVLMFVILVAIIAYQKPNCTDFKTTFLGKPVKFPINITDAVKTHCLSSDGIVGWSFPKNDIITVVDTGNESLVDSTRYVYAVVFHLRNMTKTDIDSLKNSLEAQHGKKFEQHPWYPHFQYIQVNECVFVKIANASYAVSDLARVFTKKEVSCGKDTIDCRISYYYGISKEAMLEISHDGGWGIFGRHIGRVHDE